jgi:hypothetical protein
LFSTFCDRKLDKSLLYKYWEILFRRTRTKIDVNRQANEIFQKLPPATQTEIQRVTQYHHPSIVRLESHRQWRLAKKYHKQLLRTHRELRRRGLLSLKEIRKQEVNMEVAEIIRKIIRHELNNNDLAIVRALKNPKGNPPPTKQELYLKQWQLINPAFHPNQRSSLNTIDVPYLDENKQPTNDPDKAAIWTTISDPMEIEERLLACNISHFGQAQGTLFTTTRMQQLFGYSGVTPTADEFRKQSFNEDIIPPMSQGTTMLLTH